jgi:hypothetical protein
MREAGQRQLAIGLVIAGVGLVISLVSYSVASSSGGGQYFVFWGLVVFGVIKAGRGLALISRADRIPSARGSVGSEPMKRTWANLTECPRCHKQVPVLYLRDHVRVTHEIGDAEPAAAVVALPPPPSSEIGRLESVPSRSDIETLAPTAAGTKTCPDCAEDVLEAARVCRYCRFRFERAAMTPTPNLPGIGADSSDGPAHPLAGAH